MELKTYFAQDAAGNIISSAIVNVFLQGTTTLATGLTRADGTPLENPFAADGAGRIQFRAPDGYYDVQVSAGPGIIQTLTIQCVDYSGAKADADRAEAAADRADVSAEQAQNALNSITGINSNFEQNSREQWRRSLAEAGLTLVSGSFEEGATVNSSTDAVWHIAGGQCYTWDGAFPKAVPAGTDPTLPGSGYIVCPNQFTSTQTREAFRRSYATAGYNLVDGSFESGGTLVNANDVLLQERTGKAYTGPAGTVAAGTNPASGGFVDVSFVLSPGTPKVNVAAYGFSESASAYENSIALQKAAAAVNATGGCIVEFPEGTFNVGYQDFAGAAGLGYSYKAGEYFYIKYLTKPVLLKFNNTKIRFGKGQRVGSFDPVTGAVMPTIQSRMDYRAYRGILFGVVGCIYAGVTGQLEIDFLGETVILGGEFGDRGYQCPEYGFWFIDNRQLSFNANYIAKNGAMDAIYIAGLNDSDCFSEVSGLNIDRMGRTGVVVAGGSNIRISGNVTKSGLGSIVSAPGHNFSIEPEKRKVDNVEFNVVSRDAIGNSLSVYNNKVGNVNNVRVVGGVLENNVGHACKANTSNLKYIGTTIRGVIGRHVNEFFDSDRDPELAQMIEVNHYDRNQLGELTPFKNGTHFNRNEVVQLKLLNYRLFSEGLTTSRYTLGKLEGSDINGFTATVLGDITDVATSGQMVLSLRNPVALIDFNLINRTSGTGLPDFRAYVGIPGIANARVRNAKISSVGSPTILWASAYFSAGGRDGYLTENDPLNSQPALRFLPLVVDGYTTSVQNNSGYGRVFLVSSKPIASDWDWVVGDTLIISKPTSGQPWGWKCTVAGKAGAGAVFEAMGTMP